jgi:hypothetical protein
MYHLPMGMQSIRHPTTAGYGSAEQFHHRANNFDRLWRALDFRVG